MHKNKKIFFILGALLLTIGIGTAIFALTSTNKQKLKPLPTPTNLSQFTKKERTTAENADYYVSTSGSDQNAGTKEAPFQSIEQAQKTVRQRIASATVPQGGLTVAIMGGEYTTNQLTFDQQDSAGAEQPITYRAYDNTPVVINGGKKLNAADFKAIGEEEKTRLNPDVADRIQYVDLNDYGIKAEDYGKLYAVGAFNTADRYDGDHTGSYQAEVFYNDQRMDIARYPNNSENLKIKKVLDIGDCYEPSPQDYRPEWLEQRNPKGGTFTVDSETRKRVESWKSLDDVWLFGYFYWDWADMSTPISQFDKANGAITTSYCSKYGFQKDANYYFYNIFEELDTEGEYYLDRTSGKLYLFAPADFAQADIQITLSTQSLLQVQETASNLHFDGITVQGTRGTGVELLGNHCSFTNGAVKNIAGDGIAVLGSDNLIQSNEISKVGKNGIVLGKSILDENAKDIRKDGLVMENNTADNNSIHHYGEIQKTYTSGVSIHSVGNKASHNEIYEAPHMGIFYEGNEHVIEYNNIHHVVKQSSDAGAIYAGRNLSYYGNVLRYNCIYDIGGDGFEPDGIYFDDGLSGQTAYGNVLVNMPKYGILIGGGRDNNVYNNLVINAETPIYYDARLYEGFHNDGWYQSKVKTAEGPHWLLLQQAKELNTAWGNQYPQISETISDFSKADSPAFALNPNSIISDNILLSKKGTLGIIAEAGQTYGTIESNRAYKLKDIGFASFEKGDYRFTQEPDGFEPIPFTQIGRY